MKRTLRSQADYQNTLLRNQLTSLILFEVVTTTASKGRDLLAFANHFFNRVKAADLTAKRLAHQLLLDKNAVIKTFEEILPRYAAAETTFVRQFRTMPRHGDNAPQLMITFIRPLEVKDAKAKEEKTTTKTEKVAATPTKKVAAKSKAKAK